jgi:hypothetical protein
LIAMTRTLKGHDQKLVARDPGASSGQTLPLWRVLHNAGIGNMGDMPAITPGTLYYALRV